MREMKDSGISWIGLVPYDWKIMRLKYVSDFYNGDRGSNYPSGGDLVEEGIPFLTSNNIHGETLDVSDEITKYITQEKYDSLGGAKVMKNDIIFCLRGSVGTCAINKSIDEGTVASSLVDIRPKKIDPNFLNYVLNSPLAEIQTLDFMNGSCALNLSAENVSSYVIFVPSIPEQHRISTYLDAKCSEIDALTADIQTQIDTLEQYKRSVITEAVTRGLDKNVEMKESGIEYVGKIPASWDMHPVYYYFGERKHKNSLGEEQNLLSLSYGNIIRKDINTREGLLPESFNTYNIVEAGDIIIRPTDLQNDKSSLRTGLVREHGIITSAYIDLMPVRNINTDYYHYLLHAFDVMKVFYNMGNGVRQGLNFSEFSRLMVFEPSLAEQNSIVDYLNDKCGQINTVISEKQDQLATLDAYKKSTIYEYVTGKKEVPAV